MAGVDVWASHFGLTRTPFTKSVPADKLFERAAHAEAVARVHYCINQSALGVPRFRDLEVFPAASCPVGDRRTHVPVHLGLDRGHTG